MFSIGTTQNTFLFITSSQCGVASHTHTNKHTPTKHKALFLGRLHTYITQWLQLRLLGLPLDETWFGGEVLITWFLSLFSSLLHNQKAQSENATLEGCRPRLETERGNHGELQQWSWLKQTPVYVPLYLPLCAHTPHVKPSDACTAALTCQSQLGGRGSSHLQSPPHSAMQGKGIKKKRHADLRGVLMEWEKSFEGFMCRLIWKGRCQRLVSVRL